MTYARFYGTRLLNPERYAADFSKIINEILQPLAGQGDSEGPTILHLLHCTA